MAGTGYANCVKNEQLEGALQSMPKCNSLRGLFKCAENKQLKRVMQSVPKMDGLMGLCKLCQK